MAKVKAIRRSIYGIALLSALSAPLTATAHHSYAMFDVSKTLTLAGTVKDFQFSNPHVWLRVLVADGSDVTEWNIEGTSPNTLFRRGWLPKSLQPGDKVTVEFHPLKDGSYGGTLLFITTANGQRLDATG